MGFIVQRADFGCCRGLLCFYYVWKRFHAVEIQEALLQTQRNAGNMCIRLYYTAVSYEVWPLFVWSLHWVVLVVCVLCIPFRAVHIRWFHGKSQGCSDNIIKRQWVGISEIGSSISGIVGRCYLLLFWNPPSLIFNGYRNSNDGIKRPGEAGHSPTSNSKVKIEWSYTFKPSYVLSTGTV